MARVSVGKKIVGNTVLVDVFLGDILESSSEYSIIGSDLKGKIISWNEGARRLYGYDPKEINGKSSEILYALKDVKAGLPQKIMDTALDEGKWEGPLTRVRQNGVKFEAHTVIMPQRHNGNPVGFLTISKSISKEKRSREHKKLLDNKIIGNAEEVVDFLGNILESSTEYSIIGKDLDGKIILWNDGARRLYGYRPEEVIGRANSSILHTEEDIKAGKPRLMMQAALKDGKWEGTINRRRKNGEIFTARVVLTPRLDNAGKPIGFLLMSKNISSEMRLTEPRRLLDSKIVGNSEEVIDFLGNILESSTEYSIIGKELDGTIILWNEGARRLYGYEPEEVIGKANSAILHTVEDVKAGKPEDMMAAALREGKWEGTINRRRKNGEIFTARVVITPRRDISGQPVGFLLISKDYTNEMRFSEEVRKAKLFDSAIVSNAQQAVDFITNILESSTEYSVIGKDLDGKILLWNEGARRLYGYEPEEVVGKANSAILHTEEDVAAGKPREILEAALHNGKWEGTIVRRRKNGDLFTARVVITPRRDSMGRAIGYLLISKDISDEIRLTEQLKSTQFYTRSLIESNIDALMATDPLGIISDVNKQMVTLTGYTRDELIGSPFKNYFTDPERAEEGIKLVLREGKVTNYELTALSQTGRTTVVSYNASTFRDAEGKLQGVFAAARDITEHKELEQRLRESEAYNRGLIEASVDGLITVDPSGSISDVNARMCQMSGYSREELIGTPFIDYFVDSENADAGVKQTFDKGVVTDYALTMATREGQQLVTSFNASVFKDPSGSVHGIFASARDITEQARLQTQLSEERAYNRGLIEASLDGLITVDPRLIITDVNETMCRMAGYSREDLIGSPFPQYFTDTKRAAAGVRLTLDKGAVTNYQLTLHSKDGREQLVSFNAAIFKDETGAVRGIFASARDITEQARLQEQLAEERAYNRGLIEASVDGLVTVDEAMLITDVNDTMCRMAGRNRNQLIASSFPTYFVEQERAAEGVRLTLKEGSVTNYVLTLQAADGQRVPVSFNAAVFKDAANKVRGIFASARNITDQKELEEQLQSSQFYTRSLIESNIDALMTTDSVGIITDVNQQMEALTGHTREELIGSPFKNYFTDPGRAEEGIRLVVRDGNVTNYELTARSKDGRQTVVSYNAATFYDRDGKLQGVFAAARDITEQKKLELRLRDSQAYNRGLIEASIDGLITVDPEGIISDVNDRMCQMSGYSRAELIGTPFKDYFTDATLALAGVKETFEKGVVTEYALTLVSRTRRLLQVSFNASVFKDPYSGNVRGIFASARDITDRVRLEEQLREQQTYLRGLIESSVDGLITVDPEGFITDVNEQMCRMTGYSRDELIASPFRHYFTDPQRAEAGVKSTFAEGVVTNYDLVLKTRSGKKATVSFNASVFRAADGQVQGIFASARDISEQARLQSQLVDQQAYNRSLIEASADALFAIAPDGVITDVNEEATRLTGYSRKHLINSAFADYFTEPRRASAGVQQTLAQRRVLAYELVLITRQNRRIPVSFNAGVFSDAAGKQLGILAGARNITEQKELEQQLRDQQFYARTLIESNIDALMTTDPLGIITDVNQQMEALTGYTREELIGSPFKNYFTDPKRAEEGIRLVLSEGNVTNYELTARSKDGRETVVSYNATTFADRDGKLQGVFAGARDVTERKRFEKTLQEKTVEMENANLAKDRFLANMSHELRTPLNSIIGFAGTLLMKVQGPLSPGQEKQVHNISNNGKHLLLLINDLLDLAKIESGKIELKPEPISCQSVVQEVISTLFPMAEGKGLRLKAKMPEQELTLRTDRRSLTQVLLNLTYNAIKFTEKGEVRMELRKVSGDHLPKIEFGVIDTGIGIKPEDQDKLFQAFTQVDTSSARRHEGTGLGLHLSRKLAELIKGRITFKSEFGKGSEFIVALEEK
ncbi:MAG: PAS domain S-box protein [Deltaproteobacteria bacterium]|nr:MAG: PAS domain S-box protein [Deltaproteobacteria bacterium]